MATDKVLPPVALRFRTHTRDIGMESQAPVSFGLAEAEGHSYSIYNMLFRFTGTHTLLSAQNPCLDIDPSSIACIPVLLTGPTG